MAGSESPKCGYCFGSADPKDPWVRCAKCGELYHASCWNENGRVCSRFGCGSRLALPVAPRHAGPGTGGRTGRFRGWAASALVVLVAAVALTGLTGELGDRDGGAPAPALPSAEGEGPNLDALAATLQDEHLAVSLPGVADAQVVWEVGEAGPAADWDLMVICGVWNRPDFLDAWRTLRDEGPAAEDLLRRLVDWTSPLVSDRDYIVVLVHCQSGPEDQAPSLDPSESLRVTHTPDGGYRAEWLMGFGKVVGGQTEISTDAIWGD